MAMASISSGINVAGTVHEKQMRWSSDNEEFRYDRCPLSARVSIYYGLQDLISF